jgi:hypothetical protein
MTARWLLLRLRNGTQLELARKRDVMEVALASTVSWIPLVFGSPHRGAYVAFAILFMARYALRPTDRALPSLARRLLLAGLGWSALACLAWSWLPLFLRRPA